MGIGPVPASQLALQRAGLRPRRELLDDLAITAPNLSFARG